MAVTAAIISAVASAAIAAGTAAATAPDYPDPRKSSKKTVEADLKTLPGRRAVEIAARMGIPVDYATGEVEPIYEQGWVPIDEATGIGVARKKSLKRKGVTMVPQGKIVGYKPVTKHADFTGMGEAEVQGKLARQLAQAQLEVQRKYGDQFIDAAKEQEALADPEGVAARKLLYNEIQRQGEEQRNRERPVNKLLDSQILEELQSGRGLTAEDQAAVADVLKNRADTGDQVTADIAGELETNADAETRLQSRLRKAMSYLSSGASPEDATYRARQQDMANLASFLGGRTPTAQFQQLSGGQQGAAPNLQGPALPGVNPNIGAIGDQAALRNYSLQVKNAATTASPWFIGLSALTKGAAAAGAAGWQPAKTS